MKNTLLFFILCIYSSATLWGQEYSKDPFHCNICNGNGCIYLGICEVSFLDADEQVMTIVLPSNYKRITGVGVMPLSYSRFIQEGRYVYLTVNNSNLDFYDDWAIRTSITLTTDEKTNDSPIWSYNYFYHLDCNVILRLP